MVKSSTGEDSVMHLRLPSVAGQTLLAIGSASIMLGGLPAEPARADLLVHHDLPYALAMTIAHAALESCAA
jgi:hypothetical protein